MVADRTGSLDRELAGIDALDIPRTEPTRRLIRVWAVLWPKLLAALIVLGLWQALVWSGIKPSYVIPSPATVFTELGRNLTTASFWGALSTTLQRGAIGFGLALLIGTALGMSIAESTIMRRAVGSAITGLQSMPSITWFPFAVLLFGITDTAILFVVVLGAAPSIANGLIAGVDQIPPLLLRAGKVLGARGIAAYRHVILPAALPTFVAGLKQGWAFAWRSLMAGELLVIIVARPSIGTRLAYARDFSDAPGLLAMMIVVLTIGITVDGLVFGTIERAIRRRRGLDAIHL